MLFVILSDENNSVILYSEYIFSVCKPDFNIFKSSSLVISSFRPLFRVSITMRVFVEGICLCISATLSKKSNRAKETPNGIIFLSIG